MARLTSDRPDPVSNPVRVCRAVARCRLFPSRGRLPWPGRAEKLISDHLALAPAAGVMPWITKKHGEVTYLIGSDV